MLLIISSCFFSAREFTYFSLLKEFCKGVRPLLSIWHLRLVLMAHIILLLFRKRIYIFFSLLKEFCKRVRPLLSSFFPFIPIRIIFLPSPGVLTHFFDIVLGCPTQFFCGFSWVAIA